MTLLHRIPPRAAHVGAATIRRLLPTALCRQVGPWVFVDHFGPITAVASSAHDVRPHPHVGLSTVSFLFEGAVEHRDSIGGHALIQPGEVHWMRAGHGIVHSERSPKDRLGQTHTTHGLQLWCAHPDGEEQQEPAFNSYRDLPVLDVEGVRVQLLAGHGWGEASPVDVTSPLIYALAHLKAGQHLALPNHDERCVYPVSGAVAVDGEATDSDMLVWGRGAGTITATTDAVVMILGGDAIGKRYIWWNLVHSDKAYLREQAERWTQRGFPSIPGDDDEFIPAPALPDLF